jgi:glycyl-tRNA synthetase (class II)
MEIVFFSLECYAFVLNFSFPFIFMSWVFLVGIGIAMRLDFDIVEHNKQVIRSISNFKKPKINLNTNTTKEREGEKRQRS